MKVLIISEFFPAGKDLKFSGGVESRNVYLSKLLAKNNEVMILTSRILKQESKQNINGVKIIRVGPAKNFEAKRSVLESFKSIVFIFSAIIKGLSLDFEIVEGTNFISHFIAHKIAILKNKPFIYWYPDVYLDVWIKNYGILQGSFGFVLEKLNLKSKPAFYVAISNSTKRKLVKNGINPAFIRVIPCGVSENEFKKPQNKFLNKTIISISRLVEYKNLRNLILAFKIVKSNINDANLVIVGEGPEEGSLISLAKKLQIINSIKFYKNLKRLELISLLKRSHVFCLPSFVEGFSIVTIEAAAAGLPYVVSNIPVLKEITNNGQGGDLINPRNRQQIAKSLIKFLKQPAYYKSKSIQSKKLAGIYDWSYSAKETLKIYQKAINEFSK